MRGDETAAPRSGVADLVVDEVTLVTMDSARRVLPRAWLAVEGARISALGVDEPPPARRRFGGHGGVVTPGFVNTHQHVVDSLLRGGLEADRSLLDWGTNVYYPGVSAYRPEDVELAVSLNLAEGLRAGVTTVTDNWGLYGDNAWLDESAEATLDVYRRSGVRAVFARMFSDVVPAAWDGIGRSWASKRPSGSVQEEALLEDVDDVLGSIEALMRKHHGTEDGRISVCPSPTQAQWVSERGLLGSMELARRFDTVVPIHHCEAPIDAAMFPESGTGLSCTDHLNNLGLLDSRLVAAHCVWVSDRDIRLLATHGVGVAHCPTSNMFCASGIAPVPRMLAAGVHIGLGTDNTNLNSNVSMLLEMRHAALLAKVATMDAGALTAEKALEMATIDGARVLGLDREIGSLEVGKRADFVLFDTSGPHWFPTHHVPSVLAYQAHSNDVCMVVVDGRVVLDDRAPVFLAGREAALLEQAQRASEQLIDRAGLQRRDPAWQSRSLN